MEESAQYLLFTSWFFNILFSNLQFYLLDTIFMCFLISTDSILPRNHSNAKMLIQNSIAYFIGMSKIDYLHYPIWQ